MESPEAQSTAVNGNGAEETPNQRQARLRRERREAKIREQGTSRLEKITKVSGRQNLPEPPPNIPSPPGASNTSTPPLSDQNTSPPSGPTEADIRALLRSSGDAPNTSPQHPEDQDPMMKLMSMLMGGGGDPNAAGAGTEGSNETGLPPGLAAMLGGASGFPGGAQQQQQQATPGPLHYTSIWKIIHAIFALALGVYVTSTTTAFSAERSVSLNRAANTPLKKKIGKGIGSGSGIHGNDILLPHNQHDYEIESVNLFLAFATAELVLQSSRFFLEKMKAGGGGGLGGGWVGMLAAVLPEPYRGYLLLAGRYVGIWTTVVEDAMVLVFVVGCVAWWKGAVG